MKLWLSMMLLNIRNAVKNQRHSVLEEMDGIQKCLGTNRMRKRNMSYRLRGGDKMFSTDPS